MLLNRVHFCWVPHGRNYILLPLPSPFPFSYSLVGLFLTNHPGILMDWLQISAFIDVWEDKEMHNSLNSIIKLSQTTILLGNWPRCGMVRGMLQHRVKIVYHHNNQNKTIPGQYYSSFFAKSAWKPCKTGYGGGDPWWRNPFWNGREAKGEKITT